MDKRNRCMENRRQISIIKVPVGTQVRDVETGKLLLDMNVPGEPRLLLKGGRGERKCSL